MLAAQKEAMAVNSVCVPILAYKENVRDNTASTQNTKESLQKSSRAPISCLLGTMESLSERMARLPAESWPTPCPLKSPDGGQRPSAQSPSAGVEGRDRVQPKQGQPSSPSSSSESLSTHAGEASTEKRVHGVPKLLELYQFPGLNSDGHTPLPHDTSYSDVVVLVVRAQRHLADRPRYRAAFHSILSSATMEDFVLDFFWWLFLENFQPDAGVQDTLFARLATGYMHILGQHLGSQSGSLFLREFPRTVAQTLYCCFVSSFPQSASTIRNDSFLVPLCCTAYQWTGGLCPAPDAHTRWDLEALDPEEAKHGVLVSSDRGEKDNDSYMSLLDVTFSDSSMVPSQSQLFVPLSKKLSSTSQGSSQASVRSPPLSSSTRVAVREVVPEKGRGLNLKGHDLKIPMSQEGNKPTTESHVAYPATEFKRVMFDLRGNSPLVKFFMDQANRSPRRSSLLVPRTQIHKLPPAGSVTYRQILSEAQGHWAAHSRDLGAMRGQYTQDLYNLHQKKLEERYRFHRKEKKVLSQKSTVRRLCQLLVPEGNEEDLRDRQDVIRAFETALSGLD